MSVAVYVTVSAVAFFTVNVTTPFGPDRPLAAEITDLPAPWAKVTVLPATGAPPSSFRVTVTVEVVAPSAGTDAGETATSDSRADTDAAVNVTVVV